MCDMPADLPEEDQPAGIGLVPVSMEFATAKDRPLFESPGGTAIGFLAGLDDVHHYYNALRNLTTPESWPAWGDYTEAQDYLRSLGPDWGVGDTGERAAGDDNVCYIAVMRNVPENLYADGEIAIQAAAIITLVNRPSRGGWLVHGIGPTYLLPEEVPHD
jgi:hypothetical protein